MKQSGKKIVTAIITFAFILPFYFSSGQETGKRKTEKKTGPASQGKKIPYKNYIWIEGEDAVSTNFAKEKTYNFFCSNRYALQLSKDADPKSDKGYFASYIFHVPRSKSYDFWMGCSPPGSTRTDRPGYASPIEWKIDDGKFKTASSENTFVKEYYAPGGFYWVKVSTGKLGTGKHTLTFRVKQKRTSGWDYYFYIDAILFLPTYSGELISLMKFPGTAPGNFTTGGKGIRFRKAEEYRKLIKRDINYRENIFNLLQVYGWLYENNKAVDQCREYLKGNPRDIEIRILLASNLAWGGRLDEAIKEYKTIVSIDKKNITARKLMAVLAGWNNRYDEAIKNYEEIIRIDPLNVDAYISLATQLSWKGEVNRAIAVFQKAETIAPDNIEVLYALGDNYNWGGKTYDAIRQFKKIISLDEKEINAYKKLAQIYLDAGQVKNANAIMEEAVRIRRIYPELSAFSLDLKGEQEKQKKAAINEYLRALEKDPEDLEARKNLIDNYRWNRIYTKAIEEFTNLLNMKILKNIDSTGGKIGTLEIETLKLSLMKPLVESLNREIKSLNNRYADIPENIKKGKALSGDFTTAVIDSDYRKIRSIAARTDLVEKTLTAYSDVLSYYNRDIQGYLTQKNALKWEIDRERLLEQARNSEKNMKGDFRPKKVIGMLELFYGSSSGAASSLGTVYGKDPMRAFPQYPLSLVYSEKYGEAELLINKMIQSNKLKKTTRDRLRTIVTLLANLRKEKGGTPPPSGDRNKTALGTARLSIETAKRLDELSEEQGEKLKSGKKSIRYLYEKGVLEQENDNVPVYKEIGEFYLNTNRIFPALDYYDNILQVQPLNVDINFKIGNLRGVSGYWKTAMGNFEICINNQVDNALARKEHYELQKEYSPSLESITRYYSESAVTRISENLNGVYPLTDWFTLKGGYGLVRIDEQGGQSQSGQTYPGIKTGAVMHHLGKVETEFRIIPLSTTVFLSGTGNYYTGEVDFEQYDTYDSKISYSTFNYGGGIKLSPLFKIMSLRAEYQREDISDLTQSLRLTRRDEITSNTISASMDISPGELDFPLSDRFFLFDSIRYRMLSDSNTRVSSYNELTYRLLRFTESDMKLDLSGVYSYESSGFTEYDTSLVTDMPYVPYWVPESLATYGGGIRWLHTIENIMKGKFQYILAFQYTLDTEGNTNMNPGIKLNYRGDHVSASLSYLYSYSKIDPTTANPDPDPFISHDITFGIKGKFFTVYTPTGRGEEPINIISANPKFITADNDGKDDFTTITMTAFDETGINSWRLDITDTKGKTVNTIARKGAPPATLKWDGTDKTNILLPAGDYLCRLTIVNSAGKKDISKSERIFLSRKKRAVTLEKSYTEFSPNKDGIRDTISFGINASDKDAVESWKLSLKDAKRKQGRPLREITGFEFLPYDVQWDGKNSRGEFPGDGTYTASISIRYKDRKSIQSPAVEVVITTGITVGIKANRLSFTPEKNSIVITPRSSKAEVESWKLMIHSTDKRLVKLMSGSGKIPGKIGWNGTDDKNRAIGYNMPLLISMEVADRAGNRGKSDSREVWADFLITRTGGKTKIILFDQEMLHKTKSASFKAEAEKIIRQLVTAIKKQGRIRELHIISHTNSDGSEKNNLALSQKRAVNLGERLKSQFAGVSIKTTGMGESAPYKKGDSNKWDIRYEIEIN